MEANPAQRAIELALSGNWKEAADINLQILKNSPDDIDALNRLARAYSELGQIAKAKTFAKKVLNIDSVNPIALKAMEKWKSLKKGGKHIPSSPPLAETFLEEPGKTKIITLIHPGDEKTLAKLDSGDKVSLLPHPHRVSVISEGGKYIGRLPDDLAARLRRLIKEGNSYQALIKSIVGRDIKVFVRGDVPSFPTEKIDYVSFTPPELVHKESPEIDFPEEG